MINNVKKIRIMRGLTQQELAYKIGISESQLRNIENNRTKNTSIETVLKMKEILNVTVEELYKLNNELEEQNDK